MYDLEVYPNYFLALFHDIETGSRTAFVVDETTDQRRPLAEFLKQEAEFVGFNNHDYDDVLLAALIDNLGTINNAQIKSISNDLINYKLHRVKSHKLYKYAKAEWMTSIDLAWIFGSGKHQGIPQMGLKGHAARLSFANIQELPYPDFKVLTETQKEEVKRYCHNDVDVTVELYKELLTEIQLRRSINAQHPYLLKKARGGALGVQQARISELIFAEEYFKRSNKRPGVFKSEYWSKPRDFKPSHTGPIGLDQIIASDIAFKLEHNQKSLETIKTLRCDFADEADVKRLNKEMEGSPFTLGDTVVDLKCGGLHSRVDHRTYRSQTLVDLDVKSYYPNLILSFNEYPDGLDETWLEIYRDKVRAREEIKDRAKVTKSQEDINAANSLKILANAVYGKLGDKFSLMYDPILGRKVTIRGQLYLLMFMEELHLAGITILFANTDGVMIDPHGNDPAVDEIARRWQEQRQLVVEKEHYDGWIGININDYLLTKRGKPAKKKGKTFNNPNRNQADIIPYALAKYFIEGETDIESLVGAVDDIKLFTMCVRAGTAYSRVERDGLIIQKLNRFYVSTEGKPIYKCKDGGSREQIANTQNSKLANVLPRSMPGDLDRQWYISKIEEAIYKFEPEGRAPPKAKVKKQKPVKEEGRVVNLTIFVRKEDTRWRSQEMAWDELTTLFCGDPHVTEDKDANLLFSLARFKDIDDGEAILATNEKGEEYVKRTADNVENVSGLFLDYDNENSTFHVSLEEAVEHFQHIECAIYPSISHKRKKISDGAIAKCAYGDPGCIDRFRVVIPFKDNCPAYVWDEIAGALDEYCEISGQRAARESFEISRGFYGPARYPDGGEVIRGTHNQGEFLDWRTFSRTYKDRAAVRKPTPRGVRGGKGELLYETLDIAGVIEKLGLAVEDCERDRWTRATCPWLEQHTDRAQSEMMFIQRAAPLENGFRWQVSCKHQNHNGNGVFKSNQFLAFAREILGEEGLRPFCETKGHADISHVPAPETETARSIREALQLEEHAVLIEAHTGSGKTEEIANEILRLLKETLDNVLVVVSQKEQMVELGRRVAKKLASEGDAEPANLADYEIELVEAKAQLKIGAYTSRTTPRQGTRVVITHAQLLGRRGEELTYYKGLQWLETRPHVLIDECDHLVEGLTLSLDLGARYRLLGEAGSFTSKCFISARNGNCAQCEMRKYTHNFRRDAYGIRRWKTETYMSDLNEYHNHQHIDYEDRRTKTYQVHTMLIAPIRQSDDPGEPLFDGQNVPPLTELSLFEDFLRCAWRPTEFEATPTCHGFPITPDEMREKFITSDGKKNWKPEDEIRTPITTCKKKTLTGTDRRPMMWIANLARRIRLFTATITTSQRKYYEEMLPGLKVVEVLPEEDRKVSSITVIALKDPPGDLEFWKQYPAEKLSTKTLYFHDTKTKTKEFMDDLVEEKLSTVKAMMLSSSHLAMYNWDRPDEEPHNLAVTYPRSPLGRGKNLPQYGIVIVGARSYKPRSAFPCDELDSIDALVCEEMNAIAKQNLGRVFRKTAEESGGQEAHRLAIIGNVESTKQLKALIDDLQPMSTRPIQCVLVPPWVATEELIEEILYWNEHKTLSGALDVTIEVLKERAKTWGGEGLTMKEMKQRMRWGVLVNHLDGDVLSEIEQVFEENRGTKRVDDKWEEKHRKSIKEMIEKGMTHARIRNNKKVDRWTEDNKEWFEETYTQLLQEY